MPDSSKTTIDRMMVKLSHLDALLGLVGEVIITSNNMTTTNRRIQEFYDHNKPLDKVAMEMIRAAEVTRNPISSDLHGLVMDIRMVEVRATFQRFRRSVRDMAKDGGKQVEFVTEGEDTLVDKTIAEKLYDPITHQIRNAIDHGIEDPLERQGVGKDTKATLLLRGYQKENNVFIEIRDDGRGMDADAIVSAAVNRGVISADEAKSLSDDEKFALVFHPGLSTKATASKLSGRGVGMDVVKSNIEELGGEIIIKSEKGKGTSFTYRIPQITAVNILDCLTVRAEANYFAVPILNVVSTLGIPVGTVHTTLKDGSCIKYLDSLVPFFDLNGVLTGKPLEPQDDITVVIVEAKNGRIALRISELLTPEKLVYNPLSDMFHTQGISGTTMVAGNRMGLTLDIVELIELSKGNISRRGEEASEKPEEELKKSEEPLETQQPVELQKIIEEPADAGDFVSLSSDIGREVAHKEEFFIELAEMVKEGDEQILSLESNPSDKDVLNKLFRVFHSMKGNLMMVGLGELGNFVHEVEALLDQARSGEIEINTESIDILLDASDTIKEAQKSIASNKAPKVDKSLLKSIEAHKKQEKKKEVEFVDVHQKTFHLESLEKFNLIAHSYTDRNIYQIYLEFKPQYQEPFLVALLILRRITRIGHVFGTVPEMEQIEGQAVSDQLKVMFTSELSQEKLKEFIETVLVAYYDVTGYDILKT